MAKGSASHRSETFGRLLSGMVSSIAYYEGKTTAIVEEELGASLNVVGKTVQRYKAGYLPPNDQTVRLLAEAGVRRGFLGREWLQRFLHAARYPFAEKLLDELCPAPQVRPRPPRVYENLPAPTYSQFVMRQQAFAEVCDGLGKRTAVVLIVGLGGNGKTSLAREVAAHSLRESAYIPRFDAVVWVSDKDRPGTTNLSLVLDEIARTLDYPGFTQFEHDEKRREVEQLLRRQRVLLVVDNFETITDGALLAWLLNLPEPSKALVTTREYRREWRSSWPIELRGMREAEAWELISERGRTLKIEQLVGDRSKLEPLVVATGGNPKALTMTLGLVKHERRPLPQVMDDLYAARGDLFTDLFARAWALLDEAARRVLLVATFFPMSASGEALSASADVQGFALDRAVERLTDLALLDVQQTDVNSPPRYALHPLVRTFAAARLAEQSGFEEGARERWIQWYVSLVQNVGHCWSDLKRLDVLDPECEAIDTVASWASGVYSDEVIRIAHGVDYYYFVRGLWTTSLSLHNLAINAAEKLNNITERARWLTRRAQMLCRQGDATSAWQDIQELTKLETHLKCSMSYHFWLWDVLGLYYRLTGDVHRAQQEWESAVVNAGGDPHVLATARNSIAGCLYESGLLDEAEQLLLETLVSATEKGFQRLELSIRVKLVNIRLDRKNLTGLDTELKYIYTRAQAYKDRRSQAKFARLTAHFHTLCGDIPAAQAAFLEAIDLFERLGMRRELAEARQALADLDARVTAGETAAPA